MEAPREAGKYVFRFIKSLFPYDLIHKDYLGLGRSNVWQVVEPGAHSMDMEPSTPADSSHAVASPHTGLNAGTSDAESVVTPASSQGAASPMVSTSWIGLTPPSKPGSGHRRSGSGSSTSLLSGQLASHAEGIVGRLPAHPLAWILRQFSSEDELSGVRLEDVVELSHQVEDDVQACILAKRLAAAAHQPGPGRRAVVDAGGVWALLNLAKWDYPDIQRHAANGLHSLVTYVPTLFGGMHDPVRRVLTFGADFPHDTEPLTQGALAQAGFYSQPLQPGSDRVICIQCGVIVEGWVQGQVPVQVAAYPFPGQAPPVRGEQHSLASDSVVAYCCECRESLTKCTKSQNTIGVTIFSVVFSPHFFAKCFWVSKAASVFLFSKEVSKSSAF